MTSIIAAALLSLPPSTNHGAGESYLFNSSNQLPQAVSKHAPCSPAPLKLLHPVTPKATTNMSAQTELAKSDLVTFDKVYAAIKEHEPRGLDNPDGVHPDGVSYGRPGATQMAVDRLIEEHYLAPGTYDLSDPVIADMVGRAYLRLGLKKRGSLWGAVEFYHGDPPGQIYVKGEKKYAQIIWDIMMKQQGIQ